MRPEPTAPPTHRRLVLLPVCLMASMLASGLIACGKSYEIQKGSIATLDVEVPLDDIDLENAAGEAIRSYAAFLDNSDVSELTPEAIRRLADLQIERGLGNETGRLSDKLENSLSRLVDKLSDDVSADEIGEIASGIDPDKVNKDAVEVSAVQTGATESIEDFEKRASGEVEFVSEEEASIVDAKSTVQAIKLYKKLLKDFPEYPRTDQVLYQLSRAYQEIGDIDEAIVVLGDLVTRFPDSRYMPESNFRRGEYFFTRNRLYEAEVAYQEVIDYGIGTQFYEHSLYKQGWTMFKQNLYEESLIFFFALLDIKLVGDFERGGLELFGPVERQRIEDTFRSISLTFSYIGGPADINTFFKKTGERSYEPYIYSNFAEFYFSKNRYSDAVDVYRHFTKLRPFHFQAPFFQMRMIEVNSLAGFLRLVIEEKKVFARDYDINSDYWTYYSINERPKVVEFAKSNLHELATHHHALYQYRVKNKAKTKPGEIKEAYDQAIGWYRVLIQSFPKSEEAPQSNYNLAELYFQGKEFQRAAKEFGKTAYKYGEHELGGEAGYSQVVSLRRFRDSIDKAKSPDAVGAAQDRVIDASVKFGRTFPQHKHAATIIIAVSEDLFKLKRYEPAISEARFAITTFGDKLDPKLRFSMWRIVAYSSFDLNRFDEAEEGFTQALKIAPRETEADRAEYAFLVDNLGASVYRQGEVLRKEGKLAEAAAQFLRVGKVAPNSQYRPNAEYDAADVYIELKQWPQAIQTLQAFRVNFPQNELQPKVTQSIAFAYKESNQLILAAQEYERVETESKDEEIRRAALLEAADLYRKADQEARSIAVYEKYVDYFPKPLEFALDTRQEIADTYKKWGKIERYYTELRSIIEADRTAGAERTDRTRYLAGTAALVFVEPLYKKFTDIKLTIPLEKSLARKQAAMEKALDAFTDLSKYKVASVTSAATYYIASSYQNMATSLINSEPPAGLDELELEEYQILIEDQAFPFEDNAVVAFEKNIELLDIGVYDEWVKKSLAKLAELLPLQYAKSERRPEAWEQIL